MRRKYFLLSVCIITTCISTYSQIKGNLSIGDTVPDFVFKGMINHPSSEIRLSAYKDKLVILDFWATWCAPCAFMLRKTDSIQQALGGKVAFLPITYEPSEKVKAYLQKYNNTYHTDIVSASGDSNYIARWLFNYNTLPHYVWINPQRVVTAITGLEDVTLAKVKAAVEGISFPMTVKKDKNIQTDRKKSFFWPVINNVVKGADATQEAPVIRDQDLLVHSTLTGFIEGFQGLTTGQFPDSTNNYFRTSSVNVTLPWLYRMAVVGSMGSEGTLFNFINRCVWNVKDTTFIRLSEGPPGSRPFKGYANFDEWKKENSFCYELRVPSSYGKQGLYTLMHSQLNEYFGYMFHIKGTVKPMLTDVYALEKIPGRKGSFMSKDTTLPSSVKKDNLSYEGVNVSFKSFIDDISFLHQTKTPLIDMTGYKGPICLSILGNLSKIEELNNSLYPYGLLFRKKKMKIDMIVFEDVK